MVTQLKPTNAPSDKEPVDAYSHYPIKSKRKAARKAMERICNKGSVLPPNDDVSVNLTTPKVVPIHAWSHDDWIALCETEDSVQDHIKSNTTTPYGNGTRYDSFTAPQTPNLNSLLKFNIAQLRNDAHTSSALLQKFLPYDEPEVEWDHSPEFFINDGHYTWDESNCMDDKIEWALQPRPLFSATNSPSESVTSCDSNESTFFDAQKTSVDAGTPICRSDHRRKGFRRNRGHTTQTAGHNEYVSETPGVATTHEEGLYVNNLAPLEMQLEDDGITTPLDASEASDLSTTHITPPASNLGGIANLDQGESDESWDRPQRTCRKPIDYRKLHTVGRQ